MAVKRKVVLRQCVGCGDMKSKRDMVRVIKTSEGEIFMDDTGKKNGRGAYICKSQECFEKAKKNKGLERSLKTVISNEIYEDLGREFEKLGSE